MWGGYFYLWRFDPSFFDMYPSKRFTGPVLGILFLLIAVKGLMSRKK
jgi:hypothetical protein